MKQEIKGTVPVGAYSPGILAEGRFLYVSGQGPLLDGQVIEGSIREQTALAIENLRSVLEHGGADLADVVRVGVFLADIRDFEAMNEVYLSYFPVPLPARTTIAAQLPGIKVEIDCVAALRGEER